MVCYQCGSENNVSVRGWLKVCNLCSRDLEGAFGGGSLEKSLRELEKPVENVKSGVTLLEGNVGITYVNGNDFRIIKGDVNLGEGASGAIVWKWEDSVASGHATSYTEAPRQQVSSGTAPDFLFGGAPAPSVGQYVTISDKTYEITSVSRHCLDIEPIGDEEEEIDDLIYDVCDQVSDIIETTLKGKFKEFVGKPVSKALPRIKQQLSVLLQSLADNPDFLLEGNDLPAAVAAVAVGVAANSENPWKYNL